MGNRWRIKISVSLKKSLHVIGTLMASIFCRLKRPVYFFELKWNKPQYKGYCRHPKLIYANLGAIYSLSRNAKVDFSTCNLQPAHSLANVSHC